MDYAIVKNGIVVNIAVSRFPLNETWIPCGEIPVRIGDEYDGENFYRDGEKVMTEEERLRHENKELSEYAEAARILLGEVST